MLRVRVSRRAACAWTTRLRAARSNPGRFPSAAATAAATFGSGLRSKPAALVFCSTSAPNMRRLSSALSTAAVTRTSRTVSRHGAGAQRGVADLGGGLPRRAADEGERYARRTRRIAEDTMQQRQHAHCVPPWRRVLERVARTPRKELDLRQRGRLAVEHEHDDATRRCSTGRS